MVCSRGRICPTRDAAPAEFKVYISNSLTVFRSIPVISLSCLRWVGVVCVMFVLFLLLSFLLYYKMQRASHIRVLHLTIDPLCFATVLSAFASCKSKQTSNRAG